MFHHDVFISHSTKDKQVANAICAELESNGIRCWIAPRDILPGRDFEEAIIDALNESKLFIFVFSMNANQSNHAKRELSAAARKEIMILPFKTEDIMPCRKIEYILSDIHWLDALTPPLIKHIKILTEKVKLNLEKENHAHPSQPFDKPIKLSQDKKKERTHKRIYVRKRIVFFFISIIIFFGIVGILFIPKYIGSPRLLMETGSSVTPAIEDQYDTNLRVKNQISTHSDIYKTGIATIDSHTKITLEVAQGSPDDRVSGTVTGVDPHDVKVVVFTRTNQWNIQPFADNRAYIAVNADGTYETWIRDWQQVSAFVISKEYDALSEQQVYNSFPLSFVDNTNVMAVAAYPSIHFSGYDWAVKAGNVLGPDDNSFSAGSENVSVDAEGRLHLKITKRNGTWYCAEVYLLQPLGYGNYNFQFSSRVDLLDKNVVGNCFIFKDTSNELDVEFSRWGEDDAPNAQYVVQPYYRVGNRQRFFLNLSSNLSTHIIKWQEEAVSFQTISGHYLNPPENQIISQWNYSGTDVPPATNEELVHFSLWLSNGKAPANETGAELVVQSFVFNADESLHPQKE